MKTRTFIANVALTVLFGMVLYRYYVSSDLFEFIGAMFIIGCAGVIQHFAYVLFRISGMTEYQEPKYGAGMFGIYNRKTGKYIPSDEPVFIFRAKDHHSLQALRGYLALLENDSAVDDAHREAVKERIEDFKEFRYANYRSMQMPTT